MPRPTNDIESGERSSSNSGAGWNSDRRPHSVADDDHPPPPADLRPVAFVSQLGTSSRSPASQPPLPDFDPFSQSSPATETQETHPKFTGMPSTSTTTTTSPLSSTTAPEMGQGDAGRTARRQPPDEEEEDPPGAVGGAPPFPPLPNRPSSSSSSSALLHPDAARFGGGGASPSSSHPGPDKIRAVSSKLCQIAAEMDQRYSVEFDDMIDFMKLNGSSAYDAFAEVAKQLLSDKITWGKVITLLALGYRMAKRVIDLAIPDFVQDVISYLVTFISRYLAKWIADRGGWLAILNLEEGISWSGVFSVMGVGFAILAAMSWVKNR